MIFLIFEFLIFNFFILSLKFIIILKKKPVKDQT